jgi:hypothetical protein
MAARLRSYLLVGLASTVALACSKEFADDVSGFMTSPLRFDLAGSSFAAIPLEDGCEADPIPMPAYECSML